jgi:RNA polymerase sigma factor (TIGR02999 family)
VADAPDVTGLLHAWSGGDRKALDVLEAALRQDLREIARRVLARERGDDRWRPTELIQELFVRLLDHRDAAWQNRAHFFATAARMMRHAIVDAARARRAQKRGAGHALLPMDGLDVAAPSAAVDVVAVAEALDELALVSPRASQVVELRFFGGFDVKETAEALGVSVRTVINDWNAARAWLHRSLASHGRGRLAHDA